MEHSGAIGPSGHLALKVIRNSDLQREFPDHRPWPGRAATVEDILTHGTPQLGEPPLVNQWRRSNLRNLWRGYRKIQLSRVLNLPHFYGQLWLTVFRGDGTIEELGLASMRLVTTAGVNFIATRLQDGNTSIGNFDFHGFGTGTTAEAVGDTALVTEETTQYNPDNTRPTGTPTNPSGNVYRTVGTYSPDSGGTRAITEHGVFTQAATGGGTLLDRSVFSAVNLVAGSDSLQATYDFTIAAGG